MASTQAYNDSNSHTHIICPGDEMVTMFEGENEADCGNNSISSSNGNTQQQHTQKLPKWRLFTLVTMQGAFNVLGVVLYSLLVPKQVLEMVGPDRKSSVIGITYAVAQVTSIVGILGSGALSDRTNTRFGKRSVFMVIGGVGTAVSVLCMAWLGAMKLLGLYITVNALRALFNEVALVPYQALLPDLVPAHQMGEASGWLAMLSMIGNVAGAVIGGLSIGAIGDVATTLPLALAPIAGSLIVDIGNEIGNNRDQSHLGYSALFATAGVVIIVAAVLVSRVNVGGPPSPRSHSSNNTSDHLSYRSLYPEQLDAEADDTDWSTLAETGSDFPLQTISATSSTRC
eukprot:TRINITY_DN16177_c0_g1_i1.p1 TRINITY_DN16177_c0_g1~~TRINITY_DN16177_c0_g1_i1.p1  ORF type:complete len:342 (-),score=43.34 TRINITY_DN16177_c0_g1_i1:17-1042(-)